MALLRIYGDEAGTMPEEDNGANGDIFVAATVAVLGNPPQIDYKASRNLSWLINEMKDKDMIPGIAFIKPVPDYGNSIKKKMDKGRVMAQYTHQEEIISLRNYVWVYCMIQAIGKSLIKAILKDQIDGIEIILDEKSFAKPTRYFFKHFILNINDYLKNTFSDVQSIFPEIINVLSSRVNFSQNQISLCWSDEIDSSIPSDGLILAHNLASKYRKGLLRSDNPVIKSQLGKAGFKDIDFNFTEKITTIDPRVIENWKRNTGLPELTI